MLQSTRLQRVGHDLATENNNRAAQRPHMYNKFPDVVDIVSLTLWTTL